MPCPRLMEWVRVRRVVSRDSSGEAARNTPLVLAARIERQEGLLDAGAAGTGLTYGARVFTIEPLQLTDAVFFPEDDVADINTARRPMRVDRIADIDGLVSHWETYL